ncbi:DUF2062 domain-containing protein [Paenibacillus roseipurpureus]|uniref:DUF2062 domain-containing protein n=1 Tax=Paenibacillus roseopurpureus TaxID=2918901 RepID=A0AA96RHS2_9BACL|nr:DUF2062 domain-containing protein [Paenibacillus sp. MBLB1832]WNR43548.1 DUF2062 domain-containing protein [Paenibacillus sp. MBLB1832]
MQSIQKVKMMKARYDWKSIKRWFKYKYILLLRAKGGPSMVARGFSIGLFVEMFTLPTAGFAFALIFPLVYLLRANLPAALIGFVFGKVIYIPFSILNKQVGEALVPKHFKFYLIHHLPHMLSNIIRSGLDLIIGGMVVGLFLGIIAYFPVVLLLKYQANRRKEKRRLRKDQLATTQTKE